VVPLLRAAKGERDVCPADPDERRRAPVDRLGVRERQACARPGPCLSCFTRCFTRCFARCLTPCFAREGERAPSTAMISSPVWRTQRFGVPPEMSSCTTRTCRGGSDRTTQPAFFFTRRLVECVSLSRCLWLSLALSRCLWLSLALSRCLSLSLALSRCLWLSLALSRSLWLSLALSRSLWLSLALSLALSRCLWLSLALSARSVRQVRGSGCGCPLSHPRSPKPPPPAAPPSRPGTGADRAHQTRRVQLVRRDGRDVSTLYGREGGGRARTEPTEARGAVWDAHRRVCERHRRGEGLWLDAGRRPLP
jgi:hypothetical protein